MSEEKTRFLVCYDYGQGGLWGIMLARSENEIAAVYPELTVVHQRPAWMSQDKYDHLVLTEEHDIDGAPWGLLDALLADRSA